MVIRRKAHGGGEFVRLEHPKEDVQQHEIPPFIHHQPPGGESEPVLSCHRVERTVNAVSALFISIKFHQRFADDGNAPSHGNGRKRLIDRLHRPAAVLRDKERLNDPARAVTGHGRQRDAYRMRPRRLLVRFTEKRHEERR
ncbi:hypothetical protein SDC9_210197 [bioreactor metagenome]|uniref:Uncharacterized protein n=1 Tax=bioreactor metagenome TaxID=1076179 RepID=A0A645JFH0_9ZZZZ